MTKTITVDGQDLVICGRSGDPYFDHLTLDDHTNDFLLYVRRRHVRENAIIFDVGANIGVTTALLGTAIPHGRLYAFEPGAETFPHLLATIEANNLANCYPRQTALGASSGEVGFLSNSHSGSASHLALTGVSLGGANTRVRIQTLDEVVTDLDLTRLDLVKIDVEGFELDVLYGARGTMARFRPQVFLEYNAFTLIAFGNQNPRYVLEELKRIFPHVYRFDGNEPDEITNDSSMLGFIHDNLIKRGCVDDLLCTFEALKPGL